MLPIFPRRAGAGALVFLLAALHAVELVAQSATETPLNEGAGDEEPEKAADIREQTAEEGNYFDAWGSELYARHRIGHSLWLTGVGTG